MKTFNYTPTSPVMSKLSTIGISLFMIVFPLVAPFGIRIAACASSGPRPSP